MLNFLGMLKCIYFLLDLPFLMLLQRIEKYRPQLLKDVVGNEEIVSRLEVIGKTGNIPNLLLSVRNEASNMCL